MFHAQCVQLKKMGLAKVDHTPEIPVSDIKLLYATGGVFSTDSPVTLQFKVFFEVVFFFCRRGLEGLRELKKDSFVLKRDENNRRYIVSARDEWEKNHGVNDPAKQGGVLMERGGERCPVESFLKYLSKLHPENESFFQRPKKRTPAGVTWYDNQIPTATNKSAATETTTASRTPSLYSHRM